MNKHIKKSSASTRNSSRRVDIFNSPPPDRFRVTPCKVKKTGNLILLAVALTAITLYFGIQSYFTKSAASELNEQAVQLSAEADLINKKINVFSDEEQVLLNLRSQASELKNATQKPIIKEIESFLSDYEEAMDLSFTGYGYSYEEKQKLILKQLQPLYTDEAFRNTHYYSLATEPEWYLVKDSYGIVNKMQREIFNECRTVVRAYYGELKSDEAVIVLKLKNVYDKRYEHYKVRLIKEDSKWKILRCEEIRSVQ